MKRQAVRRHGRRNEYEYVPRVCYGRLLDLLVINTEQFPQNTLPVIDDYGMAVIEQLFTEGRDASTEPVFFKKERVGAPIVVNVQCITAVVGIFRVPSGDWTIIDRHEQDPHRYDDH
jgi:hypothetical protein